jgi:hypothetical protein
MEPLYSDSDLKERRPSNPDPLHMAHSFHGQSQFKVDPGSVHLTNPIADAAERRSQQGEKRGLVGNFVALTWDNFVGRSAPVDHKVKRHVPGKRRGSRRDLA